MKVHQKKNMILRLMIVSAIVFFAQTTQAQTTAFNFQGRLNDGNNPANGRYDLQFVIYDALVGGNPTSIVVTKTNQQLINGVFSTSLDFGESAFYGGDKFLEIQLRPAGSSNAYVILGARQQILSVPYAIKSINATNAAQSITAVTANNANNATTATTAAVALNAQNLGGVAADRFVQQDANGNVGVTGNLTQPLTRFGLPKAMLKINSDGTIAKCYNGITGAATGNCGYTVDHFTMGGYGINFGFGTDSSFVSVSVEYDRANSDFVASNYSTSAFFGHLDVYTFRFPNAIPTAPIDRPFTIILY